MTRSLSFSMRGSGLRTAVGLVLAVAVLPIVALVTPAAAEPGDDVPVLAVPGGGRVSVGDDHSCAVAEDQTLACWGTQVGGRATPPPGAFRQVSVGFDRSCGLGLDGVAICWAHDGSGDVMSPSGLYEQVSAGDGRSCGVRIDGAAMCWGAGAGAAPTSPATGAFRQVSMGAREHGCGVRVDGTVACWGPPQFGTPPPSSDVTFSQVSVGDAHTCVVRTDSTIGCWGNTEDGRTAAPSEASFTQVSAGLLHSCGLRIDGGVTCWGDIHRYLPGVTDAPAGVQFSEVSAHAFHSCGVRVEGGIECWGSDVRVGWDGYEPAGWRPALTNAPRPAAAGAAYQHTFTTTHSSPAPTFALTAGALPAGLVLQPSGVLSGTPVDPGSFDLTVTASLVQGLVTTTRTFSLEVGSDVVGRVSVGEHHACGLAVDGAIGCWGSNAGGRATPPPGTFSQVSVGYDQSCGLGADGAVTCWAHDGSGAVVSPEGSYLQVSAGGWRSCGVRFDGRAVCWRPDGTFPGGGAVDPGPSGDIAFRQVSVGVDHACGVRADSLVECWGSTAFGKTSPPSGVPFSQVTAGANHSCGVRPDTTADCWGSNAVGQALPQPAGYQHISAGVGHSCGLRSSGAPLCWGRNVEGQSSPPPGVLFSEVSVGITHSCGLRVEGGIECWGSTDEGQAGLVVTPDSPHGAAVGRGYTYQFLTTHSSLSTGFSVIAGELPPGLVLHDDGLLSGTPAMAGTFEFTVAASDGVTPLGTETFTLTVDRTPTALSVKPTTVLRSLLTLRVTYSATLTSQVTGGGLAGQAVTFVAGPAGCTATTNAAGLATCSVSILSVLGVLLGRGPTVTYAGGPIHGPSAATGSTGLI